MSSQMQPELSKEILRRYIERIEKLEEEKRSLQEDIKEVYAQAKAAGFDTKIMRQVVKIRRMDADDLAEQEALLDTYKAALGMLADTPLGEAAIERVEPPKRRTAAKPNVRELAKNILPDGCDSVSVTGPDGSGFTVKRDEGGKKIIEPVGPAPEEMPAGAILAAGASAAARGEPEDNCPYFAERNQELWLQGHREWSERTRRAA